MAEPAEADAPRPTPLGVTLTVAALALAAPVLRMLPNWWGYRFETPERVFLGLGFLPNDFRSYASFMEQARESGRFFFENEFTLAPQDGRYVLLFQWLVGRLSALLHSGIPPAWWSVQLAAGIALFAASWRLLAFFFADARQRLLCFALVAFSGGFEWLVWALQAVRPGGAGDGLLASTWPVIGWSTFTSLFAPLSTLAYVFVLCLFVLLLRDAPARRWRWLSSGALLVLLVYATHGYTAVGLGGILGATLVLGSARSRAAGRALPPESGALLGLCASFALPFALCLWQLRDPVFAASLGKAATAEAGYRAWVWPLTQGLVLGLALCGLPALWRRDDAPSRLALGWLAGVGILANLPFFSPSRFLFLLHLPLCIAATLGIESVRREGPAWTRSGVATLAALLALFATNAAVVPMSLQEVRDDPYRYLARTERDVMERMRALPRGGVLAGAVSATYLPWLARQPVYLGHWFLTPEIEPKVALMRRFFGGREATSWSEGFLRENQIRYLYVGPLERSLGRLDPALPLERVIEADGVTVYRVR